MPRDYLNAPPTRMRRDDRAVVDDAWIRQFLHTAAVGTLATVHNAQPFINQNLFVYDAERHIIYTHTARKGRTRANVEQHTPVCFSVMEMGRMLPADEALEFSVEYAGVVIFGTSSIVDDEAEATDALQQLLDKYAPHLHAGDDYRPPVQEELKRTSVFRIDIEEWSAKKKAVDSFESAFWYPQRPMLDSVRQRTAWQGTLAGIAIAPENSATMQLQTSAEIDQNGIFGDRYHEGNGTFSKDSNGEDAGRAVTLIAREDLDAIQRDHDLTISHTDSRRNLLTQGVPLNYLVGRQFAIGDVILKGVRLCEPCQTLAKSTGAGRQLLSAMLHRGGLRCDVIRGGTIRTGEMIYPVEDV